MPQPPHDPPADDLGEWRATVRTWLAGVAPPRLERIDRWGEGEAAFAVVHNLDEAEERRLLAAVRDYRRARYDAGYGALTLPADKGGAGLSALHAIAFAQEEARFAVPTSSELISVTCGLIGPAVALFGTTAQQQLARAFLRTDLLACQLFSEPGAGSDLASLNCRAVRAGSGRDEDDRDEDGKDEDVWVVDGQKVWTSGARFADYGMLLTRTNPGLPKHRGITAFLLPLDTPGVEIRPIRQMSGGASFNEVFLSGVRIPDRLRLGAVGEGWRVATATLGLERASSGGSNRRKGGSFEDVLALARTLGRTADPLDRQRLADLYVRTTLQRATTTRVARATQTGAPPGPAASLGKLTASANLTLIGDVVTDLLGARIAADTGEWGTFAWTEHLLGAPGYRLAGGTDEIQRNVIAERVLGLPAEPAPDRDTPYSQLPRS